MFYDVLGGADCRISRRIPRGLAESTYDRLCSAHDRVPDLRAPIPQAQGRSDFPARLPVTALSIPAGTAAA